MKFCFLLLLVPLHAQAFMNIESIRQSSKEGTSGSLGAKINGASGNSEKLQSELTTLTLLRSERNEYLGAGKYAYGESRHVKDTHNGNLHLRYTRVLHPLHSLETFAQTEFDEFKRLKRRDLLGVGLRTRIIKEEANALYVGTGAFYEGEAFDGGLRSEQTVRANFYLSFVRTFSESVSGNLIAYYQPSFEGFGDTRAQIDSGLQIRLTKTLALTVEYDLQYDRQPAPGVKPTDSTYLFGLAFAY